MDIGLVESVQRRMTKRIQGIHNFNYGRRLELLKSYSLERRRVRGDLVEVFKYVKSFNKGDVGNVLKVCNHLKQKITDSNWKNVDLEKS